MFVSGPFNLLFRPGLRKEFLDSWQYHEKEYPKFLKTGTTSESEVAASIITGMSRLVERGDGEGITYEEPVMGPKVIAVDKEFALGFMITRRAVEDDKYNKANQSSKWLGHAANMTYEYRAAGLLDDAFTGTYYKGIDGLALCHTAHTLINSTTTVANRPATDVQLSVAGMTGLMDLFQQMKDENGDPIRMMGNKLLIGNSATDQNVAIQIFKSQLEPFTSGNQENAIRHRMGQPEVVVSHYKASQKSYFLIDDKHNDAHLLVRRAVEFDDTHDFETDAAKYKVTTRFLTWFVGWRGWVGANPT
jgi:hypothetical protein